MKKDINNRGNFFPYGSSSHTEKNTEYWLQRTLCDDETPGAVISGYTASLATLPERYLDSKSFLSLIWYCRTYCLPVAKFEDRHEVAYLQAQSSSVTDHMREIAAESEDTGIHLLMPKEAARIDMEVAAAADTLTLDVMYLYEVFSAYPDAVCSCGRVYRLLSCLAKHTDWDDTPKARYDIERLLKDPAADMTPYRLR